MLFNSLLTFLYSNKDTPTKHLSLFSSLVILNSLLVFIFVFVFDILKK